MKRNPFTPIFGGKPTLFFGRTGILRNFEDALINAGSDYRALFITGGRGYGKTALLEQLSRRAETARWKVIDVGPRNPIGNIMKQLVSYDEITKTIDPEIEISVFGSGGKLHGASSAKTRRFDNDDFEYLFVEACKRGQLKLLVTIDEIQKVSLEDVSAISNAFQMASRKGYDVMLAVAGLPLSYEAVIKQRGCTFMRRSVHVVLGPLSREEIAFAFKSSLSDIGYRLEKAALDGLTDASFGHPYMVQLEGYYLVEYLAKRGKGHTVSADDVAAVLPTAIDAYTERALEPLMAELPPSCREYLEAMVRTMGGDRVANTGDIARHLGKEQTQLSRARDRLVAENIVYSPARGKLMFAVPYLGAYFENRRGVEDNGLSAVEAWRM